MWNRAKYSKGWLVTQTLSALCYCILWASGHQAGSQMSNLQVFVADTLGS